MKITRQLFEQSSIEQAFVFSRRGRWVDLLNWRFRIDYDRVLSSLWCFGLIFDLDRILPWTRTCFVFISFWFVLLWLNSWYMLSWESWFSFLHTLLNLFDKFYIFINCTQLTQVYRWFFKVHLLRLLIQSLQIRLLVNMWLGFRQLRWPHHFLNFLLFFCDIFLFVSPTFFLLSFLC